MLRAIHIQMRATFRWPRRISAARLVALHRTRAQLGQLEDHRLEDIGLTREQAEKEAARRLWDAPAHWLE